MKKLSIIASSVILMTTVYAQSINIKSGWQLKGVVDNVENLSIFDGSCVDYIWKYDTTSSIPKWKVYANGINTNFETISSLGDEDGFWIKSSSDCVVDTNITSTKDIETVLNSYEVSDLTQEQKDGLVFMYQEEKVARDVYNDLYTKWGNKVFTNIAKAEQSHMDAVKGTSKNHF